MRIVAAVIAALAVGLAAHAASAQTAEELRRDAKACEQPDGYLRALNGDVQQAVQRINQQRQQTYQERATREGVATAAVAAVYAQQIRSQPNFRSC